MQHVTNCAQPVSYNMELYACNSVWYSYSGILTRHVFCPSFHSFLGYYKVGDCSDPVAKNRCKICDNNTFTAIENAITKCQRCKPCGRKYSVQRHSLRWLKPVLSTCVIFFSSFWPKLGLSLFIISSAYYNQNLPHLILTWDHERFFPASDKVQRNEIAKNMILQKYIKC